MKRFDVSVEDLLIGKYGVAWKNNSYYQVYATYIYFGYGIKYSQISGCNKYITPFELIGILAYENYLKVTPCREYKDQNCNAYKHKTCKYNGENFLNAGLEVIDEIAKLQGGKVQNDSK